MSQLIPFNPSNLANFTFQPVLDGSTYNAVVTWNAYAGRYYLGIYSQQNVLQVYTPLISSPDPVTMNADEIGSNGLILANRNAGVIPGMTVMGPGVPVGQVVSVIAVEQGVAYLSQPVQESAADEANETAGQEANETYTFTYSINLVKGYFGTPLVFRGCSQQFEIG
jgi:hypothetical protein